MEKDEKKKALDAAILQIEKAYGKGSVMKLGDSGNRMNIETVPSGSLSLDVALGLGGFPKGRIIEIYGPESSGKTTVALHAVAEVQKRGGIAGFIDAEHALDPTYARNIGVDIEKCTENNLVAAKRVYTPAELEWMQAEPLPRFETLWTVKESVMKAVGKGFQLEPSSFEVLGMLNGEALAIDGVRLYCFTKRYRGYTISLCREKPIQSLIIKEISAEEILNREKNA